MPRCSCDNQSCFGVGLFREKTLSATVLRLILPPNLAAAAVRNAVAVRVEFDPSAAPLPDLLPVLALLQRWCGTPKPPPFLQLTRTQLRDLAAAAGDQLIFVENGQPTSWHHDTVVAEPVRPPAPEPESPTPKPRGKAENPTTPLLIDGSEHFLAITLPSRESFSYASLVELLKANGFTLEPSNRKWWLRDRHKTLNFLATHGERLRKNLGAEFTPNFAKNTAHFGSAEITSHVAETVGEFAVTLGVRAGSADEATLRSAVASNRGYVEADGKIFLLDTGQLQKLTAAQRALAGDPATAFSPHHTQRISPARIAEAHHIIEALSPGFEPPATWKERSAALRNVSSLAAAPTPAALDLQLRPYQRLGAAWLWHLHRHQLGGILADEMGLGKTLQALALLSSLNSQLSTLSSQRASLVVCPASLIENWRREAAHFAPQLRTFVHHADHRLAAAADFAAHDLVITSYGTLARDQ
jgi:hypothetical protein